MWSGFLGGDWHLHGLSLGDILFRLLVFYAPFPQLLNKCFCFAWKLIVWMRRRSRTCTVLVSRMLVSIERASLCHDLNGIITSRCNALLFEIGQTISKSDERIISACGTDARR